MGSTSQHLKTATAELSVQVLVMGTVHVILQLSSIHQMSLYICHTLVYLADSQSVHRVWDKALHVEVEWTVGPIPIDDKKGKEVVLRYASSLRSGQNSKLAYSQIMHLLDLRHESWSASTGLP